MFKAFIRARPLRDSEDRDGVYVTEVFYSVFSANVVEFDREQGGTDRWTLHSRANLPKLLSGNLGYQLEEFLLKRQALII